MTISEKKPSSSQTFTGTKPAIHQLVGAGRIEEQRAQPSRSPQVSIGLPVFNGEEYLALAIESLLEQTYRDFELLLVDNASTDSTPAICQAYVARDARVRYYRNPENIGAMQNWYRSFHLSAGDYFLGAAHDDLYHPDFLSKCVAVLERDPTVVICYPKTKVIDEAGNFVEDFDVAIDTTAAAPNARLYHVIATDYLCIQLLGVFRASAFAQTQVYTGYYGCDRNSLAEFALLGPIIEWPEYLFYHRLHPKALGAAQGSGRSLQELLALDPGVDWGMRLPTITRFRNYFASVARMPFSPLERARCYGQLTRLILEKAINRMKIC
jgi:glycosyltransferase involved in cell wall biosynthesis